MILIRGMQVPGGGKYQGFAFRHESGALGSLVAGLDGSGRLRSNDSGWRLPETGPDGSGYMAGSISIQSSTGTSLCAAVNLVKQV